jgi:hypothetical protein
MPRSRKFVLFPPPHAGKILEVPPGLLSLAGSMRQAGFEPRTVNDASMLISGQSSARTWREIRSRRGEFLVAGAYLQATGAAFDAVASGYDEIRTQSAVGRLHRGYVGEKLRYQPAVSIRPVGRLALCILAIWSEGHVPTRY